MKLTFIFYVIKKSTKKFRLKSEQKYQIVITIKSVKTYLINNNFVNSAIWVKLTTNFACGMNDFQCR